MFAAEDDLDFCVSIDLGGNTLSDWLQVSVMLAIPTAAAIFIARTARRHPSRHLRELGPRRAGARLFRIGVVLAAVGAFGIVAGTVINLVDHGECHTYGGISVLLGLLLTIVGGVFTGVGGAMAVRAGWVGLASMAAADVLIWYVMVLVSLDEPGSVKGLLLLAFVIHAVCSAVTARWSFNAKDLGPVERAKAGEAGRSVGAVWVFLVAYSTVNTIRGETGIFDSTAGSAVTAALTLGALAATMGSGYTKYSEAMNANRGTPDSPDRTPAPDEASEG